MIIIKTLRWSNCFSYAEDNVLNFDDTVLTQILGANGVGKSSIPLILEEVLYNKNSKGVKKADIANRELDQPYKIWVNFLVDTDSYVVDLVRSNTLKVKLHKNGEDISSHTATNTFKTIEEILGVDFKTFSQLVYQNTNNSLQFLTATDTTRKRFLIELLNLDKYVDYFELFKSLVKEYNSKVVSLTSAVDTLQKWLDDNNLKGMKVLEPLNLDIDTEKDEKLLGSLLSEFENISSTNKKISRNNLYKQQLASIDLSANAGPIGSVIKYDALTEEIGQLKSEINADLALQKKYRNMSSECPTCGQAIDISFAEAELANIEQRLVINKQFRGELADKILEITKHNQEVLERERLEKEFESLFKAIDNSLPEKLLNAKDLEERIKELKATLEEKRRQIKFIIDENNKIQKNNTRILVIQEQTEETQAKLDKAKAELDKVQKDFNNLELLKKAFSTNGLLAYKIEYLVKELEVLVNEYLSELSDGRFTLIFAVTNDKLNVHITDNGKDVDILNLSSGELARVNTSTLLAIRRLMNSISKSQINVLFLDEVIAVLDELGRERLVDVLIRENTLNTFIVSHEWSHPLLSKLSIVKEDKISRIDYG